MTDKKRILTKAEIKAYASMLKAHVDDYKRIHSINPDVLIGLATAINTLAELDKLMWLKRDED